MKIKKSKNKKEEIDYFKTKIQKTNKIHTKNKAKALTQHTLHNKFRSEHSLRESCVF